MIKFGGIGSVQGLVEGLTVSGLMVLGLEEGLKFWGLEERVGSLRFGGKVDNLKGLEGGFVV